MEDGYDNAFFGKYESVFCANQGAREDCLEALLLAAGRVYDSVKNQEPWSTGENGIGQTRRSRWVC